MMDNRPLFLLCFVADVSGMTPRLPWAYGPYASLSMTADRIMAVDGDDIVTLGTWTNGTLSVHDGLPDTPTFVSAVIVAGVEVATAEDIRTQIAERRARLNPTQEQP